MDTVSHIQLGRGLEYRFISALVAIGTKMMKGFGACHRLLYGVSQRSRIVALQIVALLLCLPIAKCTDLIFEFTYSLGRRRLRLLCREKALLGSKDHSLERDLDIIDSGGSLNTVEGLEHVLRSLKAAERRGHFR